MKLRNCRNFGQKILDVRGTSFQRKIVNIVVHFLPVSPLGSATGILSGIKAFSNTSLITLKISRTLRIMAIHQSNIINSSHSSRHLLRDITPIGVREKYTGCFVTCGS